MALIACGMFTLRRSANLALLSVLSSLSLLAGLRASTISSHCQSVDTLLCGHFFSGASKERHEYVDSHRHTGATTLGLQSECQKRSVGWELTHRHRDTGHSSLLPASQFAADDSLSTPMPSLGILGCFM